jgi:hypothetical protein
LSLFRLFVLPNRNAADKPQKEFEHNCFVRGSTNENTSDSCEQKKAPFGQTELLSSFFSFQEQYQKKTLSSILHVTSADKRQCRAISYVPLMRRHGLFTVDK